MFLFSRYVVQFKEVNSSETGSTKVILLQWIFFSSIRRKYW